MSELNIEDSIALFKMMAWPDVEFNEELYSNGFGSANANFSEHPNDATEPIDLLDLSAAAPEMEDQRYWSNPLETTLPMAPHMKIYCLSVHKTAQPSLSA